MQMGSTNTILGWHVYCVSQYFRFKHLSPFINHLFLHHIKIRRQVISMHCKIFQRKILSAKCPFGLVSNWKSLWGKSSLNALKKFPIGENVHSARYKFEDLSWTTPLFWYKPYFCSFAGECCLKNQTALKEFGVLQKSPATETRSNWHFPYSLVVRCESSIYSDPQPCLLAI